MKSSSLKKIKILVVDDEPQIRKLLRITLEANDYQITEAASGIASIQLAASILPDLIILDLNLPDEDGYEVLNKIREWSSSPIIILSVRNSEEEKIRLLDSGADDYVIKPFHTGELLARIRVALRHKDTNNENPILKFDELEINLASRTIIKNGCEINMTSTEYSILKLLAQNRGKAMTHKDILKSIWGNSFSDEVQYLRVFIGQIRKKIEDDLSNPKFIKTMPGVGYIFL